MLNMDIAELWLSKSENLLRLCACLHVPAIHEVKSAILCGQIIMSVAVIKLP